MQCCETQGVAIKQRPLQGFSRSPKVDLCCPQVQILSQQGIKEVTLLGQNVNSYADTSALLGQPIKRGTDTDADPFAIYAQVTHLECHLAIKLGS